MKQVQIQKGFFFLYSQYSEVTEAYSDISQIWRLA